jgi:4-amino-4-deoxychorismate lyase
MPNKRVNKVKNQEENCFFETIRCHDYEVFHLDFHIKRIANTIGLNVNLAEYIYPINGKLLKCKVIYNAEGIMDIQYSSYTQRKINSFQLVHDDSIEYTKKSCDRRALDALFAKRNECDEIMIFKRGLLTDTSIANVAIFDGSHWLTPKTPLLEGTTRSRLLKEGLIFEKDINEEMLQSASKIALLNAMVDMHILTDYSLFS